MNINKPCLSGALLVMLVMPVFSQAALVSATFDSTALGNIRVTMLQGAPFPAVSLNDAVELEFSWDDGQVDSNPDQAVGVYEYTAPPPGMSVLINGQQYSHSYAQGNYRMTVYNNSLSSIWGDIDDVNFSGRIDGDLPNYMSIGFSSAGQEILGSDALPSITELQAFPYIAGRFDIYAPGATSSSTVWFASPIPSTPPPPSGVPVPASLWLFVSGIVIARATMRKTGKHITHNT